MRTLLTTAGVFLLTSSLAVAAERTIRVAGDAKVAAPPDMASIRAGVTSRGATATDAMSANNKAMTAVLATLKEHGVAAKDLQTTNLSVQPAYKHDAEGRRQAEIIGYDVSNQLEVKVRDLAKLSTSLDAVVRAGANQMSGVSFSFSDSAELKDKARRGAIDDAKRRAKLYAEQAGVKLGKVMNISEPSLRAPREKWVVGLALHDPFEPGVPIAAGEGEVVAQVYVEFALED